MAREYKNVYKAYAAWNYEKEIEDLNKASDQGWQLVKGGCFHSRFVKNPSLRYRYQLDYQKVEDMGRYIETFREQGWEYVNSTFNGWHYFRKLYDPSRPEEDYEIFTDTESLMEMTGRWARIALGLGIPLILFAVLFTVRMIIRPKLPTLVQLLVMLFEGVILIHGAFIMRNKDANRKNSGFPFGLFAAVIVLGCTAFIVLAQLRPYMYTEQAASSIDEPIVDDRWNEFQVKYPDFYYLDLEFASELPMSFSILNKAGEAVYTQEGTEFKKEDNRLWLTPGTYALSFSSDAGFHLKIKID